MIRYRVTTKCTPMFPLPTDTNMRLELRPVTSRYETDSLERAVDAAWGENSVLTEVPDVD